MDPKPSHKRLSGVSVLLIEDDLTLLSSMAAHLSAEGAEVSAAADGRVGLARFMSGRPDVVVTDIVMPEREGLETIMEMKSARPDVRVLAISGGGRSGATPFLTLAKRLGADDVLAKPFRGAQLAGRIATLVCPASGNMPAAMA